VSIRLTRIRAPATLSDLAVFPDPAIRGLADACGLAVADDRGEVERMRPSAFTIALVALALTAPACGGKSDGAGAEYVRYHEPSQGWTAKVPAGWRSVVLGPAFVRGDPLTDPTRLLLRTYRDTSPAGALHELESSEGITVTARGGTRAGEVLRWQRFRARKAGAPQVAVDVAVARDGASTHLAALAARGAELPRLAKTALLPALDSFVPGAPDRPRSVLATEPGDPAYWPTAGWRTASAASQGMDGDRLDAMVAQIRAARLPIDSVTVVRHGYVVLDTRFGRFATGGLGEPYASGRLHELQSATKSITSMLLGIALHERGATVRTTLVQLAAAAHYVPRNIDARKRAITLQDLLTMQSGLAWKESGYAYTAGSGNDVIGMLATRNWTKYVVDRPMATRPGTTFVYDTGTSHLVSGAITLLAGRTAAALAATRLFAPLGIHQSKWLVAPEGVNAGGFGLLLQPRDLARLAFLYLHHGEWNGRQIVPASWAEQSTTDQVADPLHEYGYLWWLDRADGYAYMAGLYGQLAVVVPDEDLVAVITAHLPATVDATAVTRWLLESYVLPAAR
jgi:CubicO group peptidase (beta-lactamase class C family)